MHAEPHTGREALEGSGCLVRGCLDIGAHPEPTKVLNQRGQCNERLARWEAAFLDYDEAIRSTPDLRAKGRLQSAVDNFERAEQLGYTKARERLASLRQLQASEQAEIVESGKNTLQEIAGCSCCTHVHLSDRPRA